MKSETTTKSNSRGIVIPILAASTILLLVITTILCAKTFQLNKELEDAKKAATTTQEKPIDELAFDNYHIGVYEDQPYFIYDGNYPGDYDIQYRTFEEGDQSYLNLPHRAIYDFDQYTAFCNAWNFKQKFDDSYDGQYFAVYTYSAIGAKNIRAHLVDVQEYNDIVNLFVHDEVLDEDLSEYTTSYVIATPLEYEYLETASASSDHINIIPVISRSTFNSFKQDPFDYPYLPIYEVEKKPIIYLYPTSETNISVKLGAPERLTHSYPKYSDGWNVLAQPNGDLKDLKTGRNLYSLYYENESIAHYQVQEDGFVVASADVADFLEDKLALLGLNEHEAEEFIIYWLPELEKNEYNYIRFATAAEIAKDMPLSVSPTPDTTIRVIMTYKGLSAPINVKEQQLTPQTRSGYTLVEWGGVKIN